MRTMMITLSLASCGGGTLCTNGTQDEDGECVEVDDGTDTEEGTDPDTDTQTEERDLEDVLIDAQPCDGLPEDERLDLVNGCADGVCAKTFLGEAIETSGSTPTCGPGVGQDWALCTWPSGIRANIYDTNKNGQADHDEPIYWLTVRAPFGGASPDGLGLGISPGCFVERFGSPNTMTLYEGKDGEPMLGYGYWNDVGVVIYDREGGPQPYQPDGRVDAIGLYGPDGMN